MCTNKQVHKDACFRPGLEWKWPMNAPHPHGASTGTLPQESSLKPNQWSWSAHACTRARAHTPIGHMANLPSSAVLFTAQ